MYTFLKRKYDNNEEHNEDDFFWLIGTYNKLNTKRFSTKVKPYIERVKL